MTLNILLRFTQNLIIVILDFGLQCLCCLDLSLTKLNLNIGFFFFLKFIAGGTQLKTLDVKTVEVKVEPTSTKSTESLNTSTASNSSDGEGKICVEMS